MSGNIAPTPCPKCGGQMWNNMDNKRNPKAPDFACKDKQGCGAGVWLKDVEKNALRASAGPATNGTGPTMGAAPKRPQPVLDKLFRQCVISAQTIAKELFKDGDSVGMAADLELKLATTIFIARIDGKGILEIEKEALAKLAAKAEAEKREREERERKAAEERSRLAPVGGGNDWPPFDDYVPDDSFPF